MCGIQRILVLLALYMRLVHSWDIAISVGDRLEFYTNDIKTYTAHLTLHNPAAIAYDEVQNMILFVDKHSDYDAVCGYYLASEDVICFIKRTDSNIQDLAYDPATELLFFTDIKEGSINWISLNEVSEYNVYGNVLIKMNDRTINDITLDSCSGYIYWTNTFKSPYEYIERARFNGSEREVVNKYLPVFSIAIDSQTHTNYYISGYIHEFHNEVDLRENYLNDEKSKRIFFFELLSAPKELTVSDNFVYWMNNTLCYTTIWQRPKKTTSNFVQPREICKFYSEKPRGIAANYKIREHTKQKQPSLETEQTTETEGTTEAELTCVHGTKNSETSVCKCSPGYTGKRCDVADCGNYCLYGDCSFNDERLPECRCNDGYSGQRCEVNDCHGFCLNDGECFLNERGEPTCQCNGRYVGDRCEVSGCHNYCLQGSCTFNDEGHPECRCYTGHSGERCEVYACHGYCLNDGDCTLNEKDEPFCQCNENYMGSRCESCSKNDTSTSL